MERLVHSEVFIEAGSDYEQRPVLHCYACKFPDPEAFNYDELLEILLRKLDHVVGGEYVIVFFAGAMEKRPTFSWMYKAYHQLERK